MWACNGRRESCTSFEKNIKIVERYPKTEKGFIYKSTSKNELLVNQIQPYLPNTKPEGIKLDNSKSIEYQKVKYDSIFWNNYTIIELVEE